MVKKGLNSQGAKIGLLRVLSTPPQGYFRVQPKRLRRLRENSLGRIPGTFLTFGWVRFAPQRQTLGKLCWKRSKGFGDLGTPPSAGW